MLAVIGGSGFYALEGLETESSGIAVTDWGETSGPVVKGRLGDREVLFLARHGEGHSVAPHRVNYRANIAALGEAGAERVLSVATVGGIGSGCEPGTLVVPDQIIDYTWGREASFAGPDDPVVHTDFTEPYTAAWRSEVLVGLGSLDARFLDGGTYGATQGPRFESAAEILRIRRDGCTVVGMTGMPEAVLAREAGLEYAAVCPVGNRAAGIGSEPLDAEKVIAAVEPAIASVRELVVELLGREQSESR